MASKRPRPEFDAIGLTPGKEMAVLAGASELGGGLLTATGIADPLGPITLAGAMTVATAVHRKSGPLAAKGGYELALTNLALASVLAGLGGSRSRRSSWLPKPAIAVASIGAASLTGVALSKLFTHRAETPVPDRSTPSSDSDTMEASDPDGAMRH